METETPLSKFIENAESFLDDIVDCGTDQELFVAGYLHGHFSLVISQLDTDNFQFKQVLNDAMYESLQRAFEQGELEPDDQAEVFSLWQKIFAMDLS